MDEKKAEKPVVKTVEDWQSERKLKRFCWNYVRGYHGWFQPGVVLSEAEFDEAVKTALNPRIA